MSFTFANGRRSAQQRAIDAALLRAAEHADDRLARSLRRLAAEPHRAEPPSPKPTQLELPWSWP